MSTEAETPKPKRQTLADQNASTSPLNALVSAALIPVPRGMSDGFYAIMGGTGSVRDETGQLMMLAERFGIPKRILLGDGNYSYSAARLEAERFGWSASR